MVDETSNCAPGERDELRSVLICKAFFSRADFMKIKFAELSFQGTQGIPDQLEFVSVYLKSANLYDIKFSNDVSNLKCPINTCIQQSVY